jgi:hypothetical protein
MAINRALMNRQMYNMGGASLQAGAPDLRLTGVHPTYSQARKQRMNMAGGGIMGSNAGSMLVAPTADGSRPGYWGIPSWDSIKKIGQTIMPGGETGYVDLYGGEGGAGDVIKKIGQTIMPGGKTGYYDLYNTGGAKAGEPTGSTPPYFPEEYDDYNANRFPPDDIYADSFPTDTTGTPPYFPDDIYADSFPTDTTDTPPEEDTGNPLWNIAKKIGQTIMPGGNPGYFNLYGGQEPDTTNMTKEQKGALALEQYKQKNLNSKLMKALGIGTAAGAYAGSQPKDTLAVDNTGLDIPAIAAAAQGSDAQAKAAGLRFTPQQETRLNPVTAADGGRIGYANGSKGEPRPGEIFEDSGLEFPVIDSVPPSVGNKEMASMPDINAELYQLFLDAIRKGDIPKGTTFDEYKYLMSEAMSQQGGQMQEQQMAAHGGRIGYTGGGGVHDIFNQSDLNLLKANKYNPSEVATWKDKGKGLLNSLRTTGYAEGGLMNLGGNEMDLRAEGGFVPIGGKEKADDVPARLSKNEFVFTADAVRAAGGGDIDEGAQIMEKLMSNLEQGGQVSQESQGLEGAREMFQTSQKLEKRII